MSFFHLLTPLSFHIVFQGANHSDCYRAHSGRFGSENAVFWRRFYFPLKTARVRVRNMMATSGNGLGNTGQLCGTNAYQSSLGRFKARKGPLYLQHSELVSQLCYGWVGHGLRNLISRLKNWPKIHEANQFWTTVPFIAYGISNWKSIYILSSSSCWLIFRFLGIDYKSPKIPTSIKIVRREERTESQASNEMKRNLWKTRWTNNTNAWSTTAQ